MSEGEASQQSDEGKPDPGERRRSESDISPVVEWAYLDGNRLAVAGIVLGILLAVFVGVERLGWVPLESHQPVFYVFSGLIGGNLTLITVVVSINQLLLGREFESPGDLGAEIENVMEYRGEVEESAGQIAPVKPLGFLELLFESTRNDAERIGEEVSDVDDREPREKLDETVSELVDHIDESSEKLEKSDSNTFEVLSTTLTTNYAEDINRARQIRANYGDALSDSVLDALDDLVDSLQRIDVARQYFKSLYLQEELSSLSRVLLYAGFPAEVVSVLALLAFTTESGTVLTQNAGLLLPLALAVAFLPLALLFAYILRTATVTKRTVATTPFTTTGQER